MWSFTEEQFVETVISLIIEKPDFIYEKLNGVGCCYTPREDKPGCLFGQALLKLGVSEEFLKSCDPDTPTNAETLNNPTISDILKVKTDFSEKVLDWVGDLQGNQDAKISWKQSLINTLIEN